MYKFSEVLAVAFWRAVVNSVECAVIGWPWWYGPLITVSFIVPILGFIFGIIMSNVLTIWAIVAAFQRRGIGGGVITLIGLFVLHVAIIKYARQIA
jgi:hypothetical protein